MMEGHGNHWGCLGDKKEVFPHFLGLIYGDGKTEIFKAAKHSFKDPETGRSRDETVLSMVAPDTDLAALVLSVTNQEEKEIKFQSTYPFARVGARYPITIAKIQEWENGIEARIDGVFGDKASLGFFDTLYHVNKDKYEEGKTYEFDLAGVAYRLKVIEPEPIVITDPEVIARHRKSWAEIGEELITNKDGAIEISMDGAAILDPLEGCAISDFAFRARVRAVSSFRLEGQTVHVVRGTLIIIDDQEFEVPIYVTDHALEGPPPKPGDNISGRLWLQGYLASEETS